MNRFAKYLIFVALVSSFHMPCIMADDSRKEISNVDPRLSLADDAQKTIQLRKDLLEKTIEELYDLLEKNLNAMPDGIANEQVAVETLLAATKKLHDLSKEILAKSEEYQDNIAKYNKALKAAPPIFRQAAVTYRDFAAQETYSAIADDYLTVADTWEKMADVLEKRSEDLLVDDDTAETIKLVRSSSLFLERFYTHLLIYPRTIDNEESRKKFLETLRSYIRGYETIRTYLHQFHDNLSDKTKNPDGSTSQRKPIENLTAYVGEIKLVFPSAESARIIKTGLANKYVPYADKPFSSDSFYNLLGKTQAPVRQASYQSNKPASSGSDSIRNKTQAPPLPRAKNDSTSPPPKTTPSRDRTTRYAPPSRYFAPPPPVVLVRQRYWVGPNGLLLYPPPAFVVNYPMTVAHR